MASAPLLKEIKKQASFFLKEKIKTARLALTDVTPVQLMVEEATNGNPGGPDTRTLKIISRAAFEVDDYWRVVEILHKRLANFDKRCWRAAYKALIVLEHLLCHGPESVAEEFQSENGVIKEMGNFQHIDEKGFNWGLSVRKKSERILKLLENRALLKEERNIARKITRGIQGFGSFSERTISSQILQESSIKQYERCNSQFNDHGNQENLFPSSNDEVLAQTKPEKSLQRIEQKILNTYSVKKTENENCREISYDEQTVRNNRKSSSSKENKVPAEATLDMNSWEFKGELNPLLDEQKLDSMGINISRGEEDHPFSDSENLTSVSLLSVPGRALQAC